MPGITKNGYLVEHGTQNPYAPKTKTSLVDDIAKNQALSYTLADTPDKDALGYGAFSTLLNYSEGDIVYYNNKLWKCKTGGHSAGAWDANDFEQTSVRIEAGESTKPRVLFIENSFGKYDTIRDITLTQATSGKYVNTDGGETTATGYGISSSIELNFGDILLVPSTQAVPTSVSVVARIVTRTYQKVINYEYTYQVSNPSLYATATADYDQTLVYTAIYNTSGDTPVLTGWSIGGETIETLPSTHEVTESYYEPLVKQAVSAMPSTGYYVYLCSSAMTVVISGLTSTVDGGVCKAVGWGIFKNIVSNFVGAPGQSILAQLLCDLDARVNGIMERLENLGEVKAITIDCENLPMVCGQPMVVSGSGAPSVVPQFVGQRYHDTTNRKVYEAFAVTGSTNNWTILN